MSPTRITLALLLCSLAATGCKPRTGRVAHSPPAEAVTAEEKVVAEPKGAKATGPEKATEPGTWIVEGWGQDVNAAKEHAAKNVREKVIAHLHRLNPPLVWKPGTEDIGNLVWGASKRQPELDQPVEQDNKLLCWSWKVSLPPVVLENWRREDVKYRAVLEVQARTPDAEARMLELAKGVGWLVLVLAGVWLYVVVDQWTAGARRPWLRFGLASVAVAAGVGLWYLA